MLHAPPNLRYVEGVDTVLAALAGLAAVAIARGQPVRAAHILGAVEAECERQGWSGRPPHPVEGREFEEDAAAVRAMVDEVSWQATWTTGRAMSIEEAVSYALVEARE